LRRDLGDEALVLPLRSVHLGLRAVVPEQPRALRGAPWARGARMLVETAPARKRSGFDCPRARPRIKLATRLFGGTFHDRLARSLRRGVRRERGHARRPEDGRVSVGSAALEGTLHSDSPRARAGLPDRRL